MRFGNSKTAMLFGIAALLCISLPARATEFASPKSYPVGTNPSGLVVADFNGDGKPDIAVVNPGSNNVSILLGNGDGTFQAAKNFDVGNSLTAIFAADFNGDGKQDLAVFLPGSAGNSINGEVRILLGNGDGTFQAPVVTTLTVAATILNVGDFNGDKKADLVLSNVDPNTQATTLELLVGKGDGTFQPAKQIPASDLNARTFTVADFNNDGKLDLAVGVASGVQVLLGNGDGTFQSGGTVNLAAGFAPDEILAADLNGDGRLDLIVDSRQSVNCAEFCTINQRVSVFLAEGSGTFQNEILILTASRRFLFGLLASDFLVGDFTGDGKNDLGYAQGTFEVRLGKGDGTFSTAIPFAGIGAQVAVADLNGDKLADLIAVDSGNNQVVVLLNDSPTSGADLGFTAASGSPATAGVGLNLTYTADILDEGPEDSTNVQFTDTLPAGVTFVSASSSQGTCSNSQSVVTCDVGSLRFAQDATITIVVTPTVAHMITNSMSVAGTEPDLALANNSAQQTNTVVPTFTLTVTKTGAGTGSVNSEGAAPLNPQNGMIACGTTCTAKFLSGTTVNLSAAGDSGDFFSSWGGACSGNGSCSVLMNSDQTVTANFVVGVTLSVTLAGSGSGSVEDQGAHIFVCTSTNGDCSPVLFPGTSVSMQAIPSGNSVFTSWSGACTGTDPNTCIVTMNGNQNVTATFNPPPDFSLSPAASSLTTTAGGQVTDVISISEQGGFSSAIQLSCVVAGPAPLPACSLSPNSIPSGANSPTSTLTFIAGTLNASMPSTLLRAGNLFASLFPLGLLGCVVAFRSGEQRKRWALCLLLLVMTTVAAACGGGSGPPPPKMFAVTVTAISGQINKNVKINVTVN